MAENARITAVKLLQKLHLSNGYSHILLDNALGDSDLDDAERALLSHLVYGVEERRLTIDHLLASCTDRALSRLHPCVLEILRVGAYQLVFMDRIPASAAVNEAVKTTRVLRQGQASGFVNGVLRSLNRRKDELLGAFGDDDTGLMLRYSCPTDLIALWRQAYGEERMRSLLEALNGAPPTALRLNTLQTTPEKWAEFAAQNNVAYSVYPDLPASVCIEDSIGRKKLAKFGNRCYYYQDIASQLCVKALSPQQGESIADVCAAPGGKSMTAAQEMNDTGRILCGDIHGEKCDTIAKRAAEYGFHIIQAAARDASKPCPKPLQGAFDRVICDVPCSGLGVIRRKPEIRYKPLTETHALPELQYRILEEAAKMVRPGGVLQYSTCTLRPSENEEVVHRFLRNHPEFSPRILPLENAFATLGQQPDWHITLFPSVHGTDGFFIAGFERREGTL